jgi:predicted ATP-dependent protease
LIPEANVKNLMLREDVVQAAEEGQFHIYAVSHVDQGIELLTGVPAGTPDEEGLYPEGTINRRVNDRLAALAEKRQELAKKGNGEEEA